MTSTLLMPMSRIISGKNQAFTTASDMLVSLENVARTYSALVPTSPNSFLAGDNDVPAGRFDFETVLLHEVGHCIGLAHPNLGSESGLTGSDQDFTRSTDGPDNTFDLDDGAVQRPRAGKRRRGGELAVSRRRRRAGGG